MIGIGTFAIDERQSRNRSPLATLHCSPKPLRIFWLIVLWNTHKWSVPIAFKDFSDKKAGFGKKKMQEIARAVPCQSLFVMSPSWMIWNLSAKDVLSITLKSGFLALDDPLPQGLKRRNGPRGLKVSNAWNIPQAQALKKRFYRT